MPSTRTFTVAFSALITLNLALLIIAGCPLTPGGPNTPGADANSPSHDANSPANDANSPANDANSPTGDPNNSTADPNSPVADPNIATDPNAPTDPNTPTDPNNVPATQSQYVVFGYNELGMHCMNQDFSELMLLPPYNNLRAQVLRRGEEPRIITSGATVNYALPGNTHSVDKTNFWTYAKALLNADLAPNVGLTGNGLSGTMVLTGENDWVATGIPITPLNDLMQEDAYQLADVTVQVNGAEVTRTQAVVPVSWEISCNLCHTTPGISVMTDILRKHDTLHATTLEAGKPVLCAGCHADPALGAAGQPGVSTMSGAMHTSHAPRMSAVNLVVECYACHPGQQTECLRDVHYSAGMVCNDCHTSMAAVGSPTRTPWVDEPRCTDCHHVAGHQYEQTGTLYRMSVGHGNVHCVACHNSPHAITPTVKTQDNLQAIALQGHPGTIDTCVVCHTQKPDESFFHTAGGEDE